MPNTRPSRADVPAPQARHTSDTPRETRGTVVIKVGGSVAGQTSADADIVAALHDAGTPLVVVHGGGPLVGEWSTRVGLEPRFERGLRVTDEATRDVALAVLAGLANSRLVAALVQRGVPAVGLSGIDGGLLRAERESVDLGLVGRVTLVDSSLVEELIDAGRVPVIAPAALESGTGELLNVNADSVAGAVAASIGARLLAFITDVPGVRGRDGKLIPLLDRTSAGALVEDGTIEGGMLPKVEACLLAASAGCRAAIVASGGDGLERLLGGGTAGTVFEIAE